MRLTKQGVRDLNALPGAKRSRVPRANLVPVVAHSCRERTRRIDCFACTSGMSYWSDYPCNCRDQCLICGREF